MKDDVQPYFGWEGSGERRLMEDALHQLLEAHRCYDQSQDPRDATLVFSWATQVFVNAVGHKALVAVYGDDPPDGADRGEQLSALASRLFLASRIFPDAKRASPSSLSSAFEEVLAISKGDQPFLFEPLPRSQGKPVDAYTLARRQLRALEWYAALRGRGDSPAQAQSHVVNAFGLTWDAISRWKKQVKRELGDVAFDRAIRLAESGTFDALMFVKSEDDILRRLLNDGIAYRAIARRRLTSV